MKRICEDCPQLRSVKVPGFGSKSPGILFVGESPGANEVEQMRAFSPNGASGQLLGRILHDLGEDPNDHYYDNVVMCPCAGRPPAAKLNVCVDGLFDRIEELEPRLIVPMGNTAAKAVGMYERGISFVRAQYRELELDGERYGILPTYHPAAVLRTPELFRDFAKDVEKAVRIANGEPAVVPPPYEKYDVVLSYADLKAIWPKLQKAKVISVDLEYRDSFNVLDNILEIGIGYGREQAASIDWKLFEESDKWLNKLADLLETKPNIYQHAMADITYLWEYNIFPRLAFDTEIGHWLLDERASGHGLEAMAIERYNAPPYKSTFRSRHGIPRIEDDAEFGAIWAKIPKVDRMLYNAADADYTWRLGVDLKKELKPLGMMKLMKLLLRCTELYSDLYVQGIWIDLDNLDALEKKLLEERDSAEEVLREYAPDVNPRSFQQLAAYLYDELGLESMGGLSTEGKGVEIPMGLLSEVIADIDDEEAQLFWKTSRPALFGGTGAIEKQEGLSSRSTGMFMLYWLAQQHPYPRALIRYKMSNKRLSTYVGQVRRNLWPDGRIRPEYRIVGHLHGRFGTKRPVIHNLPNEQEIYNLYTAPPGYTILTADYKQADLRMIAHFADDDNLREWLKGDPHAEVVKIIRKIDDEELERMKKERPDEYKRSRLAGKAVNFGMPYGRGAESLAPQLGMSPAEAKVWMQEFWARLHKTKAWMDGRVEELLENQEFIGPFGNRRRFPLLISRAHRSKAAKLGVNFPIMSSVNYLTALAHVEVTEILRGLGIDCKVYPHIHDAISIAVPIENAEEAAEIMKDVMAEIPLDQGFDSIEWPVDVEAGTHWGAREPIGNSADSGR